MSQEITVLLQRAAAGEREALDDVFRRLYPELQRMALGRLRGQGDNTLSPTVLVHELYGKLSRSEAFSARDRVHFFSCAARAMRQIVVDHARARNTDKRGGGVQLVTYDDGRMGEFPIDALRLDAALRQLEEIDPELLEVVELRYFTGLTMDEISAVTDASVRTLHRRWRQARAVLQGLLEAAPAPG